MPPKHISVTYPITEALKFVHKNNKISNLRDFYNSKVLTYLEYGFIDDYINIKTHLCKNII